MAVFNKTLAVWFGMEAFRVSEEEALEAATYDAATTAAQA